jgi:hypothetical protein
MKNFVYHTSRNCFASIRTCNTRLSTRSANRTHAGKPAVSGFVIQISITVENSLMPTTYYKSHLSIYSISEFVILNK